MSNVINIMNKQRKIKHLFVYESYDKMNNIKTQALSNMSKQKHLFNDLGSRIVMEDRILDFTFKGDNLEKLIGNSYQVILVYGKMSEDDRNFLTSLLENEYSQIKYIARSH